MTDPQNVEPQGTLPGTAGQPAPASGTTPPTSAIDPQALRSLLEPIINEAVSRQFQSAKHKRIAGQEAKLDDFGKRLARFEELTASGLKREQALSQLGLEEDVAALKQAVQGTSAPSPTQVAGSQAGALTANADPVLSSMITALKIDANSPEVTEILRAEGTLPERVQKVLALAGVGQAVSVPVPPGQRLPGTTGGSVPVNNIDSMVSEMQALQVNPSSNMKRYLELSAKLREMGIG